MSIKPSFECNMCGQMYDDPDDVTGFVILGFTLKEVDSPSAGSSHLCKTCYREITHADDE